MFWKSKKTGFRSEIDIFFHEFDKNRTQLPASRKAEIAKHQKIFYKRDKPVEEKKDPVWQEFSN